MDVNPEGESQAESAPQPAAEAAQKTEVRKDEPHPLLPFIEWAVRQFDVASFRDRFRVTSHGLFVLSGRENELIELYRKWLSVEGRPVENDDARCRKKIFGSDSPERIYLHEPKATLWGHLAVCPIKNPQAYRVAFYLGTPGRAGAALHPEDPTLAELKKVELVQKGTEYDVVVKHGDRNLTFDAFHIKRFQGLCRNSKKVQEHFPKFMDSPAECIKALEGLLSKARTPRAEDTLLVPKLIEKSQKEWLILENWGFFFYFDKNGRIRLLYHIYGRSFGSILREEYLWLCKDINWRRPVEIFFSRGRASELGQVSLEAKRVEISWDALGAFIHELNEAPSLAGKEGDWKTAEVYIGKFAKAISRAQPIERSKVGSYIPPRFGKSFRFFVNEVWIFVASKSNVVVDCIARTAKNRRFEAHPPKRPKDRPAPK